MIKTLLHKMFEEKNDFYSYMDLYHKTTDSAAKETFKTIAEQEMHHYKDVYDLIFKKDRMKTDSPMDLAMCEVGEKWYKDMEETFRDRDKTDTKK